MGDTCAFLTSDHRHCDQLFAAAERAAAQPDWAACVTQFSQFRNAVEQHFAREEELLFPAFEEATGMRAGPTVVMRGEHDEVRELLRDMQAAVESQDATGFLGLSDTLLIMLQQHNLKEENMLYPMAERALPGIGRELIERMEQAG